LGKNEGSDVWICIQTLADEITKGITGKRSRPSHRFVIKKIFDMSWFWDRRYTPIAMTFFKQVRAIAKTTPAMGVCSKAKGSQ